MSLVPYMYRDGSIFTLKNNIIRKTGLFITFSMTLTFNAGHGSPVNPSKSCKKFPKHLLIHNGNGKLCKARI